MAIEPTLPATTDSRHPNTRHRQVSADPRGLQTDQPLTPRSALVKRLVGYTIGLGRRRPAVCIPAFFFGDGEATANYEDTTIIVVRRGLRRRRRTATWTSTETITVDFPGYGKHGIFRFWDLVDENDAARAAHPEDITVTRDGSDEPFELS